MLYCCWPNRQAVEPHWEKSASESNMKTCQHQTLPCDKHPRTNHLQVMHKNRSVWTLKWCDVKPSLTVQAIHPWHSTVTHTFAACFHFRLENIWFGKNTEGLHLFQIQSCGSTATNISLKTKITSNHWWYITILKRPFGLCTTLATSDHKTCAEPHIYLRKLRRSGICLCSKWEEINSKCDPVCNDNTASMYMACASQGNACIQNCSPSAKVEANKNSTGIIKHTCHGESWLTEWGGACFGKTKEEERRGRGQGKELWGGLEVWYRSPTSTQMEIICVSTRGLLHILPEQSLCGAMHGP